MINQIDNNVLNQAHKIVLSNPTKGFDGATKCDIRPPDARIDFYDGKRLIESRELDDEVYQVLAETFPVPYRQLDVFTPDAHYGYKVSKKGKLLQSKQSTSLSQKQSHSAHRTKNYLLEEGVVIPALVDLGVFTPQGAIVPSKLDKFKQINRFVELVDDVIGKESLEKLHIVDFGCGKSYLTFVLYHYLTVVRGLNVKVVGLDLKEQVVRECNQHAATYGYENLTFQVGDIAAYQPETPIDMVITLHACDTATDWALYHAIKWNARYIFSVPCCQHELNAQIEGGHLKALTRYGIVKERFSALATDTIRGNVLISQGYKTQLLEFVDFEHTPKNILIRAVKSNIQQHTRRAAVDEIQALQDAFGLDQTLYRLVSNDDEL